MSAICCTSSLVFRWPPGLGMKTRLPRGGSPRSARTSFMPRKFISISAFSVSSFVNPPHSICGTTFTLYLYFTAAARAMVPGRLRVTLLSSRPSGLSVKTSSFRCEVKLIYEGSYSSSDSIVLYMRSMLCPFRGGSSSKVKSGLLELFIRSITVVRSIIKI